jgi:hypothetical protein
MRLRRRRAVVLGTALHLVNSQAVGAIIALILLAGGTSLHAQDAAADRHHREGFWIGFGVGVAAAHIDCTPCGPLLLDDPWEGGTGFGLYLAMGGAVRPDLLLGGELNVYGKRNSAQERDATLGALSAVVQFYPLPAAGLFLKAGAGLGGSILAGGPGLIESGGWAVQGGGGYDVRLGRRFALAPFATFVHVFSEGDAGRNQGVPARGPRNPRYVQLGLGFHWD